VFNLSAKKQNKSLGMIKKETLIIKQNSFSKMPNNEVFLIMLIQCIKNTHELVRY